MIDTPNKNSLTLTPEILEAAYHILLGRAPESPDVLSAGVNLHKDTATLRKNFASYPETRRALFALLFDHLPFNDILVKSKRGFQIYINLSDLGVSSEIFLFDEFEPHNEAFILETLMPNETFIDIGANIGWFTLIAAQKIEKDWRESMGPKGQVIGFEANINTSKLLMGSVQNSPYRDFIKTYNVALAPELSMLEFEDIKHGNIGGGQVRQVPEGHVSKNHDQIKEKYADVPDPFGDCQKTPIAAAPLDNFLANETQKIGLIKMDVEGSEPYVLRGAKETFKRHQPKLMIEFHKDKLEYSSDHSAADVMRLLSDMNYVLYDFQSTSRQALSVSDVEKILDHFGYFDFLALPR
jgi:FkbM family methyltransferase